MMGRREVEEEVERELRRVGEMRKRGKGEGRVGICVSVVL